MSLLTSLLAPGNGTLLASASPSAGTPSVDLTSIPGTYRDLELVISAKGNSSTGVVIVRFNADAGANYDWQRVGAAATAATGTTEGVGVNQIEVGFAGSTTLTSVARSIIPGYARTGMDKACTGAALRKTGTATGNNIIYQYGGYWRSTAAITQITVTANFADGFGAGTTIDLYGRK